MSIKDGEQLYRRKHNPTAQQSKERTGIDAGRDMYLARHGDTAARDRLRAANQPVTEAEAVALMSDQTVIDNLNHL